MTETTVSKDYERAAKALSLNPYRGTGLSVENLLVALMLEQARTNVILRRIDLSLEEILINVRRIK